MASFRSSSQSAASPTSTAALIAMQRWPAAPQVAPTRLAMAWSLSASGRITRWFLAPASAWTRFPFVAARV